MPSKPTSKTSARTSPRRTETASSLVAPPSENFEHQFALRAASLRDLGPERRRLLTVAHVSGTLFLSGSGLVSPNVIVLSRGRRADSRLSNSR